MKIKFRLAIIAVIAMISSMAWAQETFPVKTDKYGFYSVQSTPTSVTFIKASTFPNDYWIDSVENSGNHLNLW